MSGPVNRGEAAGTVTARPWGQTAEGQPVTLYELRVPGGLEADITDYGGIVVRLRAPDRHGALEDVVLGHDRLEPYLRLETAPYFGALIGRYGNRIARGRFTLDGQTYGLPINNGPNSLHGGERGFGQRVWTGRPHVTEEGDPALELTYVSPGGEQGYPGTLTARVTYTLTRDSLHIAYEAVTDAPTVVNLTNHSYWNLSGEARRSVLDHELTLHADHITPVDETLIPTGELMPVAGTVFDFREPRTIGARVEAENEQLRYAGGYDHNFVLRGGPDLRPVAEVLDPVSGRRMTVHTTEPGVQFYSGNFLDGSIVGKGGQAYGHRWALCLETQHFPDSPNHPGFPSTALRPGERRTSQTVYTFSAG